MMSERAVAIGFDKHTAGFLVAVGSVAGRVGFVAAVVA